MKQAISHNGFGIVEILRMRGIGYDPKKRAVRSSSIWILRILRHFGKYMGCGRDVAGFATQGKGSRIGGPYLARLAVQSLNPRARNRAGFPGEGQK